MHVLTANVVVLALHRAHLLVQCVARGRQYATGDHVADLAFSVTTDDGNGALRSHWPVQLVDCPRSFSHLNLTHSTAYA